MTGSEGTQLQRPSPSLRAEQNAAFQFVYLVCMHSIIYSTSLSFFCCKSMKANFKENHIIHYRSEYRPLQTLLWDISVPTMMLRKIVTSLRNIEPKFVKLQHFGTERDISQYDNLEGGRGSPVKGKLSAFSFSLLGLDWNDI